MSIEDATNAAIDWFPSADRLTMIAIAGAESNWNPTAEGDRLDSFSPEAQARYAPFAFGGYLSFGYWQIFLGVHTDLVRLQSGLKTPGELATWLMNGSNNARVAATILASQGKEAWSTYNDAQYLSRETEASAALAAAIKADPANPAATIVAVSFNGTKIHLDHQDGSFDEYSVTDARYFSPWLRMEVVR